ncbi:UDP-N-acetylmuramoyl-tripeptide--D-alanyl-D-alanine ligase [Effusibacillus dendaii]|uniref:UDP-N-acetylmuramoyl-tripeptide--D-alanyl-D-alanine ligase n=1 Tax=Effusibacillus dendaii TaxID=2743772 RepID=A0A7I8D7T4_9BACL|nr:UDP-N-acetylmuramoyl-tripeptide--D-alanyl-D-alanine ligase [Effusibacillus dendaii]BCJ86077.1 UDP-N-acetylmuramoyl-tripeptide--D-alanyl-D-alanine ligase [Effusibacillus dendaii]
MIEVTVEQLVSMAEGNLLQGSPSVQINGVATDSRAELAGRLFVPLIGERFDAHEFLADVVSKGAAAALWQKDRPLPEGLDPDFAVIGVDDTIVALQKTAAAYRRSLSLTVVGVTGSNGKTSTKDILASVLSQQFQVQKTQGNLNNHIGLPLMVLSLRPETDVAILEMGMSGPGEIALLARIAAPQIGIITYIGEAHIEFFGDRSGIAAAKFELVEALPPDGLAVLFGDEPLLRGLAAKSPCPIRWFGFQEGNDVQVTHLQALGLKGSRFQVNGDAESYHLPVPGAHQVGNALAAVAVAKYLGMLPESIERGLQNAALSSMRLEVKPLPGGGFVVNDAYNASPTSMRAALRMIADTPEGDFKAAVLGDMLELGEHAVDMHYQLGQTAAEQKIDLLVAIGQHAGHIAAGAKQGGLAANQIFVAETKQDAVAYVKRVISQKQNPVVLVKASRGMKLEEVVTGLLA